MDTVFGGVGRVQAVLLDDHWIAFSPLRNTENGTENDEEGRLRGTHGGRGHYQGVLRQAEGIGDVVDDSEGETDQENLRTDHLYWKMHFGKGRLGERSPTCAVLIHLSHLSPSGSAKSELFMTGFTNVFILELSDWGRFQ